MTSFEINEQITELQKKYAEALTAEKALVDGNPQAFAEYLHSRMCFINHTDGCSWGYEKWDKPGYAKKEWLEKAAKLLSVARRYDIAPSVLAVIVSTLHPHKYTG